MPRTPAAQALFNAQASIETSQKKLELAINQAKTQASPFMLTQGMVSCLERLQEIAKDLCHIQNKLSK